MEMKEYYGYYQASVFGASEQIFIQFLDNDITGRGFLVEDGKMQSHAIDFHRKLKDCYDFEAITVKNNTYPMIIFHVDIKMQAIALPGLEANVSNLKATVESIREELEIEEAKKVKATLDKEMSKPTDIQQPSGKEVINLNDESYEDFDKRVKKLKLLKENGLITAEEFINYKENLLPFKL